MKQYYFIQKAFLVLTIMTNLSCEDNRLRNEEVLINERIANIVKQENSMLILDTITGFDWDELLVIGPYMHIDTIENRFSYDLKILPKSIESFDKRILLGFIDHKTAVRYMVLNRTNFHDTIFIQKGMEYRFYPKEKTQLNFREE